MSRNVQNAQKHSTHSAKSGDSSKQVNVGTSYFILN